MADELKANIEVNMHSNVDEETRHIQEKINSLTDTFERINSIQQNILDNELSIDKNKVDIFSNSMLYDKEDLVEEYNKKLIELKGTLDNLYNSDASAFISNIDALDNKMIEMNSLMDAISEKRGLKDFASESSIAIKELYDELAGHDFSDIYGESLQGIIGEQLEKIIEDVKNAKEKIKESLDLGDVSDKTIADIENIRNNIEDRLLSIGDYIGLDASNMFLGEIEKISNGIDGLIEKYVQLNDDTVIDLTGVKEYVALIDNGLADVGNTIDKYMNKPLKQTEDEMNTLANEIDNIENYIHSGKGLIDTKTIDDAKLKLEEFINKYFELIDARDAYNSSVDNKFIDSNTVVVINEVSDAYKNLHDEIVEDKEVEERIKRYEEAFSQIRNGIDEGLLNPMSVTKEELIKLADAVDKLYDEYAAIDFGAKEEQAGENISKLQNDCQSLIGTFKNLNSEAQKFEQEMSFRYGDISGGMMKKLLENSAFKDMNKEVVESTEEWRERITKAVDDMNGTIGNLRVNSVFEGIKNEVADVQNEISNSGDTLKENVELSAEELLNDIVTLYDEFGNMVRMRSDQYAEQFIEPYEYTGDILKENVESKTQTLLNDTAKLYDAFGNEISAGSKQFAIEFTEPYKKELDETVELFTVTNDKIEDDTEDTIDEIEDAFKEAYNMDFLEGSVFEVDSGDSGLDLGLQFEQAEKSASGISDAVKDFVSEIGIADIAVKGIKKAWDEFSDTLQEVIELAEDIGGSLVGAFETVNEVIEGTIDLTEELADKFYNLADKGVTLQQKWFTIFNYMGGQGGTEIQGFLNDLQAIYGVDADNLTQGMRSIASAVRNMGLSAEQSVKAVKQFTELGLDLSAYTGLDYNSIINQIQSSVNMGYLGRNSPLIQALGLTDKDVETFKSLNTHLERANFLLSKGAAVGGTYEKWINTAAGKVQLFSNALSRLDGDVQRLAIQLFAKLAPALTAIINLVDNLVVGITKLFGYDLTGAEANLANMGMDFSGLSNGLESVPEEIEEVADSVDNVSDSMDDMSDNTDEVEKHLASFDDVIQINDTDDNAFSNLADTGGIEDLGDSLTGIDDILDDLQGFDGFGDWGLDDKERELSELEEKLQEIADLLLEGKFDEAGQKLNSLLQDALVGIPWEEIQEKASKTGIAIAQFLNGLIEDKELFTEVGNFFAQGLNTVVHLIRDFAGELHWNEVGVALSESWKGFWEGFDSEALGQALFNVIHGVFETFWSFVYSMWAVDEESGLNGWDLAGSKIADVLNTFFEGWTDEDITQAASSIISFVDGVFEILKSFIDNLNAEDIKEKLLLFIKRAFQNIAYSAGDWGATIGEMVKFIIELIQGTIEAYDSSGLRDAIKAFLSNAHIGDLVWSIMLLRLKIWWESLGIEVGVFLEGLGNLINNFLLEIFKKFETFWFEFGMGIKDFEDSQHEKFIEFIDKIKQSLDDAWAYFQDCFNTGVDTIKQSLDDAGQGIRNWWSGTVIPFFSGVGTDVNNLLNGVGTSISNFLNNILNGIQTFIGWLSSAVETIKGYFADIGNFGDNWLSGARDVAGGLLGKFHISIPHLARGGIIEQSTLVNVGEAGREAVVPLENNTGWMKSLANEFVNQMNINNNTNSNNNIINISMGNKMIYTRSEMLEFGKQIAEALELYGVTVTMN